MTDMPMGVLAEPMQEHGHSPGVALRFLAIGLTAFLTVVDLFATQAILPTLTRHYGVTPDGVACAPQNASDDDGAEREQQNIAKEPDRDGKKYQSHSLGGCALYAGHAQSTCLPIRVLRRNGPDSEIDTRWRR